MTARETNEGIKLAQSEAKIAMANLKSAKVHFTVRNLFSLIVLHMFAVD